MSFRNKYFGDKAFYRTVLTVAVPIMIQNGITNFVGLLDNIMVGQVGTEQMSGIAIVNQLLLVFNLAVFGAISGAGIFSAQFFGCGDHAGVRQTFRFKLYVCAGIVLLGALALLVGGEELILLYLHGEENGRALQATLAYGKQYLWVMLFGLPPFAVGEIYAGTLRECGETKVPMAAGAAAVVVNLALNYILIFGKFGFPALGVVGAAAATVISRFVQAAIVICWTHTHVQRMPFIQGAYRDWRVPGQLAANIVKKGTPLLCNEILWAASMAVLNQCYSLRGLNVVAATNISSTISNLFYVVFIAMGNAIAIIVGQLLGAGKMEEAKDTDRKLIVFAVLSSVALGSLLFALAPVFPSRYNTTAQVKELATQLLRVAACCMPIYAFLDTTYFTLRSGGKTLITFLFDGVYLWCVNIPLAYVLSRFTGMPILPLYLCCQLSNGAKCVIGFVLVRRGVWLNNIVKEKS